MDKRVRYNVLIKIKHFNARGMILILTNKIG